MHAVPLNDLSRSWVATDEAVEEACRRVLRSGWYILGPEHRQFERELAEYVQTRHAVAVGNGTDALRLAMQAMGVGPGTVVLAAANAGGYTAVAAAALGAHCAYADVDPRSLLLTAETVEGCLSSNVGLVVVTHLYGNVADVPAITAVCRARGIPVLEDCAQSIGGTFGGRPVGSLADAAAFSFYPTKNLGGPGDGGAVTTSSPAIADTVGKLRNYGWGQRYRIENAKGTNSRLDEFQAAVLRVGLRKLDDLNAARNTIVDRYRRAICGKSRWLVTGEGCNTTAHLAVLRTAGPAARDRAAALFAERRIATDIHYPVLDVDQPGLPPQANSRSLPVSQAAAESILTLPCFPQLTSSEVDRVCEAITELSDGYDRSAVLSR